MKYRKGTKIWIVSGLLALLIWGCGKEKDDYSRIPDVYVNFILYPNTIDFIAVGGFKYVNGQGHRGVIVYRIDAYTFMAYERTCTYDPEKESARVEVEASSVTAIDSTCMSRFSMIDGSVFIGPATRPLKQYKTTFDGNALVVHNQ